MNSVRHYDLDICPIPKQVYFINEPEITGAFCGAYEYKPEKESPKQNDNIRIYVPIDLNHESLLAYLDAAISAFKEVNWKNESVFSCAVDNLLMRVEVYDQVWSIREMPQGNMQDIDEPRTSMHSVRAKAVTREMIVRLEEVDSREDFPENCIDKLRSEYDL